MIKRPPHGCENSSRLDLFQMELWTSDQLQMCVQAISPDTRSATSSLESADGALLCNSQDGPQIVLCGQEAALASHSQPQEKDSLKPMNDISGLRSLISSRNADLNMSLGSKLQARLAKVGSMEYRQTWAKKVTPAGLPYWAHTASAVRISDKDCTGLPTPTVDDSSNVTRESGAFQSLTRTAQMAGWATPVVNDTTGSTHCYGKKNQDGTREIFYKLPGHAKLAGYPTPCANDNRDRGGWFDMAIQRRAKIGKSIELSMLAEAIGREPTSSPAPMEKRGGLNPALPRWLMGFPPGWCDCAVTATQSFPKSRRSSPKHI